MPSREYPVTGGRWVMSQAAADLREPDRASCASRAAAGMVVGMGSINPPAHGGMHVALKLVHIRSSEGVASSPSNSSLAARRMSSGLP